VSLSEYLKRHYKKYYLECLELAQPVNRPQQQLSHVFEKCCLCWFPPSMKRKLPKLKAYWYTQALYFFFCLQCNTSCFEFYSQRFYCKKQQWVFKEKHFSEDAEWTDTVTHVCHRALQTSMVNPNVLGVRNLEQISFLKNHVLLECLSSTSVARQVNSFTPGY